MSDVYVQIPAYKDQELAATLRSLFRRASHPERLRVRVAWQYGEHERLPRDILRLSRLEIDAVPATESEGPNWARCRLQSSWNSERYTLFLDSHHRFVDGWDDLAITMLEDVRSGGVELPMLTAYLPAYDPSFPRHRRRCPYKIYPLEREDGVLTRLTSMPILGWKDLQAPVPAQFLSLHFLLADGRFNSDVKLDPTIYFFGDEVYTSLRAFAAGYRFFHPHRLIGWHAYDRSARTPHWSDHADWRWRTRKSLEELKKRYRSARLVKGTASRSCRVADFERYSGLKLLTQ